jgi:CRP/FNR family transcriptional regulator, cyclic AMP receptor protein
MTPYPSKDSVAQLLLTPDALVTLSLQDANTLVGYMLLSQFKEGAVIFKAGQQDVASDYLLLVIDGEILVEHDSSGDGSVVVNVLSSGHLIGEMGVIDGAPRSATCTAQTDVDVAMLSKTDLERMLIEQPQLGARFVLAIAKRLADRVRLGNQKILMLSQVNDAMQQEIKAQVNKRPHRFMTGLSA